MIGDIDDHLVQKVELLELFFVRILFYSINRKKINPAGFCGQKSHQCTHKFLMIYCMYGKFHLYMCGAIYTALNLVKIATYIGCPSPKFENQFSTSGTQHLLKQRIHIMTLYLNFSFT